MEMPGSKEMAAVFSAYYEDNHWGGSESRSGRGSSKDRGLFLSERLPLILKAIGARTILDVPCGDMNWMSEFPLNGYSYIGADIVPQIVAANRADHRALGQFHCLDACHDPLPEADVIFCRDMVIHLPNALIARFLENVARSEADWLICTRFLGPIGPKEINEDIEIGSFRAVDLCAPPFGLPSPVAMIPELYHKWKTLGVWRVSDVRASLNHRILE